MYIGYFVGPSLCGTNNNNSNNKQCTARKLIKWISN